MTRRPLLAALLGLCALSAPLSRLSAQTADRPFPDRAISTATGYAPGGSTDIAARLLAERLGVHRPAPAASRRGWWWRTAPAPPASSPASGCAASRRMATPSCWSNPARTASPPPPWWAARATTR
ncbi:hypothetical protein [Teichococcus aestuarii]|uniref:hypothetical protein n=1 Tax=Teichococcus aestuarii TaxID=568898 RepID=UPI0036076332